MPCMCGGPEDSIDHDPRHGNHAYTENMSKLCHIRCGYWALCFVMSDQFFEFHGRADNNFAVNPPELNSNCEKCLMLNSVAKANGLWTPYYLTLNEVNEYRKTMLKVLACAT